MSNTALVPVTASILRVGTEVDFSDLSVLPGQHRNILQQALLGIGEMPEYQQPWIEINGRLGVHFTEPRHPSDSQIVDIGQGASVIPFGMAALKTADAPLFGSSVKAVGRTTLTFGLPDDAGQKSDNVHKSSVWLNFGLINNGDVGVMNVNSEALAKAILTLENAASIAVKSMAEGYKRVMREIAGDTRLFGDGSNDFTATTRNGYLSVIHTDSKDRNFNQLCRSLYDGSINVADAPSRISTMAQGFTRLVQELTKHGDFESGFRINEQPIRENFGKIRGITYEDISRCVEGIHRWIGFATSSAYSKIAAPATAKEEPWTSIFGVSSARVVNHLRAVEALLQYSRT